MVEYILSLIIHGFVALILISIGVSQIKSKEPVGFYTHEEAPRKQDIVDIEAWNKKHGWMWVAFGIALVGVHLLMFFVRDVVWTLVLLMGAYFVPLPIMMWYHAKLKKKYYR